MTKVSLDRTQTLCFDQSVLVFSLKACGKANEILTKYLWFDDLNKMCLKKIINESKHLIFNGKSLMLNATLKLKFFKQMHFG